MNAMGLTIYTQFVSITEIQEYVPVSVSQAKIYWLANLQEGLGSLHQENSFLELLDIMDNSVESFIFIALMCNLAQPHSLLTGEKEKIKAKYYFSKIVQVAGNS